VNRLVRAYWRGKVSPEAWRDMRGSLPGRVESERIFIPVSGLRQHARA
jgi:hypothetical protein